MPKRPGRERGKTYDRTGRPLEGVTSTETLFIIEDVTEEKPKKKASKKKGS